MENKITKETAHLVNWKSVLMLKKFVSRFGDIKPRKYTKNGVKMQKELRKEIIRARELGLLPYTK